MYSSDLLWLTYLEFAAPFVNDRDPRTILGKALPLLLLLSRYFTPVVHTSHTLLENRTSFFVSPPHLIVSASQLNAYKYISPVFILLSPRCYHCLPKITSQ